MPAGRQTKQHAAAILVPFFFFSPRTFACSPFLRSLDPFQLNMSRLNANYDMPVFCCRKFYHYHRATFIDVLPGREVRERRGRNYSKTLTEEVKKKLDPDWAAYLEGVEKEEGGKYRGSDKGKAVQDFGGAEGQTEGGDNLRDEGSSRESSRLTLPLYKAVASLNLSQPSQLPERSDEQKKIYNFLASAIKNGGKNNSVMFVAGPPGSGKTASVNSVVRRLEAERGKGTMPNFKFAKINGMELRHPRDAYCVLWEAIIQSQEKRSPDAASALLEKYFGNSKRGGGGTLTLLLLDEMDYLVTKKQTVLYNLFDWPTRSSSNGLIIIGIANTINLPERLLPRVKSRLGLTRLVFMAYTVEQMKSILRGRLKSSGCFEDGAIEMVARKTVGISGDVRRAFQICQEAAKNVATRIEGAVGRGEGEGEGEGIGGEGIGNGNRNGSDKGKGKGKGKGIGGRSGATSSDGKKATVSVRDIVGAVKAMIDAPVLKAIKQSSNLEALLLVSLASLLQSTGREEGGIGVEELKMKMSSVSAAVGKKEYMPVPNFNETLRMLTGMYESRIVELVTPSSYNIRMEAAGTNGAWPLVFLNVDVVDVRDAISNGKHDKMAEMYIKRNVQALF